MLLPLEDAELFFKLYPALIGFAAGRLGGVEGIVDLPTFRQASPEARAKACDRLLGNPKLIALFVDENPGQFREKELSIVSSWEHALKGDFTIERNLRKHTIFLDTKEPVTAYGVLGLTDEIVEMLPYPLPVFASAVLLPWKGQIICDGLISFHNVHLGPGIRRGLKREYLAAKARGIITSLEGDRHG
jgi:hypothetical protein